MKVVGSHRNFLVRASKVVLLTLCALGVVGASAPSGSRADATEDVRAAIISAVPLYEFQRTRLDAAANAARAGRPQFNHFAHRARLASPSDRQVTTPNNDTLYSSAWLDLSGGPVTLDVPPLPDRYHSVALMDVTTDHFAILGTSSNGGRGGRYLIVGPGAPTPTPADGVAVIRAPRNLAWALVRVLVEGPHDLAAAAAAQQGFRLSGPEQRSLPEPGKLPPTPDGAQLFDGVTDLLREAGGSASATQLAAGGLDGRARFADLPPDLQRAWESQTAPVLRSLTGDRAWSAERRRGWDFPPADIGTSRATAATRATTAIVGLAALPASEALYVSHDGAGQRCRQLVLPAAMPVRSQGFWSLTIYEVGDDGRKFLYANPLDRYAIGSRSSGLERGRGGSIPIVISTERKEGRASNWLPAPPGRWQIILRLYRPAAQVAEKGWSPPRLTDCP